MPCSARLDFFPFGPWVESFNPFPLDLRSSGESFSCSSSSSASTSSSVSITGFGLDLVALEVEGLELGGMSELAFRSMAFLANSIASFSAWVCKPDLSA